MGCWLAVEDMGPSINTSVHVPPAAMPSQRAEGGDPGEADLEAVAAEPGARPVPLMLSEIIVHAREDVAAQVAAAQQEQGVQAGTGAGREICAVNAGTSSRGSLASMEAPIRLGLWPDPPLLLPDPPLLLPDPHLLRPDPPLLRPDPPLLRPVPPLLRPDPPLLRPDPRLNAACSAPATA